LPEIIGDQIGHLIITPAARLPASQIMPTVGGNSPPPQTVEEALYREHEIAQDVEIQVRREGPYWVVASQRVREAVPA
jgi:hypothetical protein